jgi:LysR family hydrogen peroxide-inducible transcriptional activator
MNIRDLKYLIAVADYKHFGKAATACFVSQPALSMQLNKLEEELGVKLFERTNKKVLITDVGIDIAERSRKIINDVNEINLIAKNYQDPFSGDLKLGAFPTLAPYILPKIVPKITKLYPNLKLLLVEEKTDILIDKLNRGLIDIALLALPVSTSDLEYQILLEDKFYLAVPKNHKLAKNSCVSYSDINNESLLLLDEGHCLREQALDVCTIAGTTERPDFRATSMETLRQMVINNVGITLIPKLAKKENDGLVYLSFKDYSPSRTIALVWRKSSIKKKSYTTIFNKIKI